MADNVVISETSVQATIEALTAMDASGDRRTMNKMARRLGKEQPSLLQYAAACREDHGDVVAEAAIFYTTLVWSMFDRQFPRRVPRLIQDNIGDAETIVTEALDNIEGLDARPIHERIDAQLAAQQPHVYSKVCELLEEDVREEAMTATCAEVIFKPIQVVIEAFDAALTGRRPGQPQGPVVRKNPKVGRNEPCPCGSGKKYKRCCHAVS